MIHITPHALERYQERIDRHATNESVLWAIVEGEHINPPVAMTLMGRRPKSFTQGDRFVITPCRRGMLIINHVGEVKTCVALSSTSSAIVRNPNQEEINLLREEIEKLKRANENQRRQIKNQTKVVKSLTNGKTEVELLSEALDKLHRTMESGRQVYTRKTKEAQEKIAECDDLIFWLFSHTYLDEADLKRCILDRFPWINQKREEDRFHKRLKGIYQEWAEWPEILRRALPGLFTQDALELLKTVEPTQAIKATQTLLERAQEQIDRPALEIQVNYTDMLPVYVAGEKRSLHKLWSLVSDEPYPGLRQATKKIKSYLEDMITLHEILPDDNVVESMMYLIGSEYE